ncbi:MAG TPA: hypothetical protein PKA56_07300 [Solirubrobacterales bacterium]|jgi:plastocyanin|nr:hypothetical protein [Solirubrobacterales bacterium]HMY26038.1 hypothetical protein [Solirubrobacterales bacterium]HNA43234.1 hypothetical protein [Solirubrobacterales bacterium]
MKRLLVLTLLLAAAASSFAIPAGAAGPGASGSLAGGKASAAANQVCAWKWKRKKVVRWVIRHGRKKRIVTWRKVKVKVCREIPPPAPARLGVKAWEFGFTLSAKEVAAGDTIVELNNQGEDDHNLHVQRTDGGEELATPDISPGGVERIRFTTAPGTYRLWCSLPTHAERGMDTTFTAQ